MPPFRVCPHGQALGVQTFAFSTYAPANLRFFWKVWAMRCGGIPRPTLEDRWNATGSFTALRTTPPAAGSVCEDDAVTGEVTACPVEGLVGLAHRHVLGLGRDAVPRGEGQHLPDNGRAADRAARDTAVPSD
jgi:hypothetical protein